MSADPLKAALQGLASGPLTEEDRDGLIERLREEARELEEREEAERLEWEHQRQLEEMDQ